MKYLFSINFSLCTKHHKLLVNIELNSLYKVKYNYVASYCEYPIKNLCNQKLVGKNYFALFFQQTIPDEFTIYKFWGNLPIYLSTRQQVSPFNNSF